MLYWLFGREVGGEIAGLELFGRTIYAFHFITFRAALAAVTAFLLACRFGGPVIRWLRRRQIGENTQKTDSERLAELHGGKKGTPTMGGVFVLIGLLFSILLWARLDVIQVWCAIGIVAGLGSIGGLDDTIKWKDKARNGLRARTKFFWITVVGVIVGGVLYANTGEGTAGVPETAHLWIPFTKKTGIALGATYILLVWLVIAGSANAVNLTDGLDGLAAGCTILASTALAIMTYVVGHAGFAAHLGLPFVEGAGEMTVVLLALAGAMLGFLWYNCHPAEVFLGDVGALPIGGILGLAAVVARQELLLVVIGGVFVVEALSVILQVASFKLTGKRIFRIAPIHHHFQFLGWAEPKVTVRFWIVASVLTVLALTALKLR